MAMSGEGMESAGRRWSEMVVHASAQRETLDSWPLWSGTCRASVAKAARKCGTLENMREELHLALMPERSLYSIPACNIFSHVQMAYPTFVLWSLWAVVYFFRLYY